MLSPLMRVGAQVTETIRDAKGRRLSRSDAVAEANARLREVGILDPDVARRYAFQLSGGMRQRVGLAAALASDPRVLIADEPSTALDVTTQREILRLIRQLQEQRGMSVILITHDLRVAFSVCTRIYVLYAGALVEVGDAASLEHAPMHPYTHGLLASEPPLQVRVARLEAIAGTVPPAHDVLGQCAFASRCRWREDECVAGRPLLTERVVGRLTACRRITEISSQLVIRPPSPAPPSVSATSSRALVQVRELTKVYSSHSRPHRALDGVTLEVCHGESVGLVGESGSGKTTLARCLVGLEQPTTGEIRVNEIDATNYAAISGGERARAETGCPDCLPRSLLDTQPSTFNRIQSGRSDPPLPGVARKIQGWRDRRSACARRASSVLCAPQARGVVRRRAATRCHRSCPCPQTAVADL